MGRTIIVGDVHGCRAELEALLDRTAHAQGDQLVFVGDLVARGPDSPGVLEVARRTGAVIVRGNHEEKLLRHRRAQREYKKGKHKRPKPLGPVHAAVARALDADDWALLERTPLSFDLPTHRARVVHAGLLPGTAFEDQDPRWLLTIRAVTQSGEPVEMGPGALWGSRYQGPPHVIFGHNAQRATQLHRWATGLDTGCVYGGALTALVLSPGQEVPADVDERKRLLVAVAAARAYYELPRRRAV
jgi:hypothetical protein